jgi:hypothetical protein
MTSTFVSVGTAEGGGSSQCVDRRLVLTARPAPARVVVRTAG